LKYVARPKEVRMDIRITGTLENYIEKERDLLQEELGEHISKAETVRRLLTMMMMARCSPDADMGPVAESAVRLQEQLAEAQDTQDSDTTDST
jgi:hypothetical protein